jgi:hypothetical protein
VALNYRSLLKASVRVGETENGIELAAMAVLDACDRARGSDPLAVAAAVAHLKQLSFELDALCRRLALTEASA